MSANDLLEYFECAVAHKCFKDESLSKRCAQCEINYQYIIENPIMLKCGHQVCEACVPKTEAKKMNCSLCKKFSNKDVEIKTTGAPNKLIGVTIKPHLKELFSNLSQKFTFTFDLLNKCKNEKETEIDKKCLMLKNDIDLRIERLKDNLEDIRGDLHAEVDELRQNVLSEITKSIQLKLYSKKVDNPLIIFQETASIEKINKLQNDLKKMIEEIQEYFNLSFEVKFNSAETKISKELIGNLSHGIRENGTNRLDASIILAQNQPKTRPAYISLTLPVFKRNPNNWKCNNCLLYNTKNIESCVACDTPKTGSVAKAEQTLAQSKITTTLPEFGNTILTKSTKEDKSDKKVKFSEYDTIISSSVSSVTSDSSTKVAKPKIDNAKPTSALQSSTPLPVYGNEYSSFFADLLRKNSTTADSGDMFATSTSDVVDTKKTGNDDKIK